MKDILIGKIVTAVGIKGEVKVYNYSTPKRFKELKHIYLNNTLYEIEKARIDGNTAILKLSGIDDRNLALSFRDTDVYIKEEDLKVLDENSFYIFDLVGLKVIDKDKEIGKVKDVIQYQVHDNLEIETLDKKVFYLPFVKEFIKEVNVQNGYIIVSLIPGMIEGGLEN